MLAESAKKNLTIGFKNNIFFADSANVKVYLLTYADYLQILQTTLTLKHN